MDVHSPQRRNDDRTYVTREEFERFVSQFENHRTDEFAHPKLTDRIYNVLHKRTSDTMLRLETHEVDPISHERMRAEQRREMQSHQATIDSRALVVLAIFQFLATTAAIFLGKVL